MQYMKMISETDRGEEGGGEEGGGEEEGREEEKERRDLFYHFNTHRPP